jgi:hypothetical protein
MESKSHIAATSTPAAEQTEEINGAVVVAVDVEGEVKTVLLQSRALSAFSRRVRCPAGALSPGE